MDIPIFAIVWASLLLLPPAAYVFARRVMNTRADEGRRIILNAFLTLASICVLAFLGFSLTNAYANLALCAVCYFIWCFLVACSRKIRRKILRVTALLAGGFPVVCGYLVGTLGAPLLLFLSGDIAKHPGRVTPMGDGITCELTRQGFAPNTSSHMKLIKHWELVPFAKRTIAEDIAFDLDQEKAMSCTAMLRAQSN